MSLLFSEKRSEALKTKLRDARVTPFAAKDVLRASGLKLLDQRDELVAKQISKIKSGKELSALLLVRLEEQGRLIVADGFHRLCAVMAVDEKAHVHCKLT